MNEYRMWLSWALVVTFGCTSAALAGDPVSFVVFPEAELATADDSMKLTIDSFFNKLVVTPVLSEAFFETDYCPDVNSAALIGDCSATPGCSPGGCSLDTTCDPGTWLRFDSEAGTVLQDGNAIDKWMGFALSPKDWFGFPVTVGAYHWWNIDTGGVGNGGYGAKGFDGTYAYYVIAQPELKLDDDSKISGYIFFAGRDDVPYRKYYSRKFWFVEAYASYSNEELGTIKAGLVDTKFGLANYLGFTGTAPYFDGFIQDADYGVSWEKSQQVCDTMSLDTSAQFFFNDGEWNGSLQNHDQESVPGLSERNTMVLRAMPKWTMCDGSTLALGVSGLIGGIESKVPGFFSGTRTAWGADFEYTNGPLNLRGEVLQLFGTIVPTRFASGGPSNRITSFSTEAAYTVGPVKYRGAYSASFDANPSGRQNIWSLGAVTQLTPAVRVFTEYTEWTVDGNATNGSLTVIEGVQVVIHWQY